MSDRVHLSATVHGRVQGIFFRAFVYDHAIKHSLVGYVRNLPSGWAVEVKAEGELGALNELLDLLKVGPPGARVERVEADWNTSSGEYDSFQIL